MKLEFLLIWLTILLYAIAAFGYLVSVVFDKKKRMNILTWSGWLIHTFAIIWRWLRVGHPPFLSLFELVSLGAWWTIIIFLLFSIRQSKWRVLGAIVLPFTFISLGIVINTPTAPVPLNPALKSFWLYIHIGFALFTYGSYILSASAAVLYLTKRMEEMDKLSYRFILLGFLTQAIMVASGAVWANLSWGRYWAWDPIETWSLLTWILYGGYLHLRLIKGWRGKRCAWISIISLILIIICFWGVPVFSRTIHAFGKFF